LFLSDASGSTTLLTCAFRHFIAKPQKQLFAIRITSRQNEKQILRGAKNGLVTSIGPWDFKPVSLAAFGL
jgi:hypothetical protein